LNCHDLRHTFATNLVIKGYDPVMVKEILGHSDIAMTVRYSHPSDSRKMEAVESLVARAEKENANLIIRVFTQKDTLIGESKIIFDAKSKETIDLVVSPRKKDKKKSERNLRLLPASSASATAETGINNIAEHRPKPITQPY